ncbi:hypothetical protein SJI00_20595 [Pseudomonas sp. RP23018S]|uniref:hypothetical protein n=1 Tax=Pseudomonas sp. RP23018S TaxID=3096037 RepID=UPI002ACACDA6|nr:hypothetical protein [Pseudomonas sp. RP23018S]MDZ5605174.1 hypothetical protein [Pseudomonas sp. RP23018S]
MQNPKVIKWVLWLLLVFCVGQALFIALSGPWRPAPERVVSVTPVDEGGAIYEVLYDSGGATVPFVYRYFLMEFQSTDDAVLKKTVNATPFLVTQSSGAVQEVSGSSVKLRTRGVIYEFHNRGYFKLNGQMKLVVFGLDAALP